MGCIHGWCCGHHSNVSNVDTQDFHEIGPHRSNNTHPHGNHRHILTGNPLEFVHTPSHNFHLEYSVLTQRGYYPNSPDRKNQDSFCYRTQLQSNPNLHFFGVYDGHGEFGADCSNFVKDGLVEILSNEPTLSEDPIRAFESAFLSINSKLSQSTINDTGSGTTGITVLVNGNTLFVANVGDSRAVIGVNNGNRVIAQNLSSDQTPFRKDEYERVKLCGARILSVSQLLEFEDPSIQSWGDEETWGGDPPRLWDQDGTGPGAAFSRSVGDSLAEKIGVIAVPEVSTFQLMHNNPFFVIASDGVFDVLSSQEVVEMVASYKDPRDACAAIVGESYKLWLQHENQTDDITIIVVYIKGLGAV